MLSELFREKKILFWLNADDNNARPLYGQRPIYYFRRTKNRTLKAKIQALPVIAAQLDHVYSNLHQKYFHFMFSKSTQTSSFKS